MAIEVEKRGVLAEAAYAALPEKLRALGAEDLGNNDTDTIFYVTDDAQIKLQIRSSKQQAKIAWKSGGLDGASSRTEIEVGVNFTDTAAAEQLIDVLLPTARKVPTAQKRHDFKLADLSIALKYSDHWSYHIEIDEVVETQAEVAAALTRIEQLAGQLDVTLFTTEEEKQFVDAIVATL